MHNRILYTIKIFILILIPLNTISNDNNLKESKTSITSEKKDLVIPIKTDKINKISLKSEKKEKKDLLKGYDLQIHAKIVPVKSSTISSRIDATVKNVFIKEGQYFKKNQKILEFDCTILNAEADKARAEMNNAKINYESNLKLFNLNGLDKVSLAQSKADYKSLSAEYKIKEQLTKFCVVKAPFAGQMTDVYVHDHETISRGDNLFKAVDDKDLIVKAFVPSDWVSKVDTDDEFSIKVIENGKTYQGKIIRLVKNIDSVSRTMKIIGKLDKKYKDVTPGMSGYIISLIN